MTRRELIYLFPTAALGFQTVRSPSKKAPKALPALGDFVPYSDPSTENIVVRLTHPDHTSLMPPSQNRHISSESRFVLFSSDRAGVMSPFHLDLRTATPRQLTDGGAGYQPASLCMEWQERRALFLNGQRLVRVGIDRSRMETLADDVDAFHMNATGNEIVVLRQGRLQRLGVNAAPLADHVTERGLVSPNGATCCFLRAESGPERSLWAVPMNGGAKAIRLAVGPIASPGWNPDSQTILFLKQVSNGDVSVSELRETTPDGSVDRLVMRTNQFAAFSPNGDGSVMVGASRSKAQPHVIITLRSSRRDMTLCEHRASKPEAVVPVFSPNSRRVYFQSDRDGKPTLYAVNVESLVEPTDANSG